jgi:hypothetical protein
LFGKREINIKALENLILMAIINDKSYEFTTNSLRVFNLARVYTISISVKGESSQSFTAVVPKGSTITGKKQMSYNKLTVVMTEGTPYKVYLDGDEQ